MHDATYTRTVKQNKTNTREAELKRSLKAKETTFYYCQNQGAKRLLTNTPKNSQKEG